MCAFGEKVFDVIEAAPDRMREVGGIGPVRAASILAAWAEQKAVREIMVFLHSHGASTARALRSFKTYGSDGDSGHDRTSIPARARHPRYRKDSDDQGSCRNFLCADQRYDW
jgi:hypothetical protein